ncbi:mechanosensitive ion channel domain-containing protein [uncultured Roseivirga sp.]|uniref:mechanosensitive ion channel family protein n=1 Tax=uncultured Roseivirga sp. TaxID=543088 RepID=UPI0030D729BD|tara:strand:- start:86005 stop:86922 length:918 start_codon:yes stop_codon:yes gene_type:complete
MIKTRVRANKPIDQAKKEGRKRLFFFLKLILLVAILVWKFWGKPDPEEGATTNRFVLGVISYISGVLLVSLGRILMVYFYLKRKKKGTDFKDNFILGINGISAILHVIILLIALLAFFGLNAKEFFTSISIVAAAIAIISKDYIANTINGFILMFSNQLSLNDYIVIEELSGRITDITLLNVVLLSDEDEIIYVPNTLLVTHNVVNTSKKNYKKLSFDFEMDRQTLGNPDDLEDYIIKALKSEFPNINLEKFSLRVFHILKDTVNLKLYITLDKKSKDMERAVWRFTNKTILNYAKENYVPVPLQ